MKEIVFSFREKKENNALKETKRVSPMYIRDLKEKISNIIGNNNARHQ